MILSFSHENSIVSSSNPVERYEYKHSQRANLKCIPFSKCSFLFSAPTRLGGGGVCTVYAAARANAVPLGSTKSYVYVEERRRNEAISHFVLLTTFSIILSKS